MRSPRAIAAALLLLSWPSRGEAFPYIVQSGDTLASIAERFYGKIQHEQILVTANALEAQGGSPIVAGMRLEVPAVSHRKAKKGDTWAKLSKELLGSASRADVLAAANGTSPWLPPEEGAEFVVPYNLTLIVGSGDNIVTIAYRFLGDRTKAWVLDHYNGLKGRRLVRGDVVLVPLNDLGLTADGKKALESATLAVQGQAAGDERATQKRVALELPLLIADIKGGRYVDAVRRGNAFLATGALTKPQTATVQRQLLEAYAALDAPGLAAAACSAWRQHDPSARVDPIWMSPKLVSACGRGQP
ncbi:MAG: LysM domain-containing protein [Polyangiaceae bacterium]